MSFYILHLHYSVYESHLHLYFRDKIPDYVKYFITSAGMRNRLEALLGKELMEEEILWNSILLCISSTRLSFFFLQLYFCFSKILSPRLTLVQAEDWHVLRGEVMTSINEKKVKRKEREEKKCLHCDGWLPVHFSAHSYARKQMGTKI